jgi:propionyl-CoA carboxylase alpha chain
MLRHDAFRAGQADTSFLGGYDVAALVPADEVCQVSAAAAAVALAAANRRDATVAASLPGGWRNVPSQPQLTSFNGPRGRIDVRYYWTRTGIAVASGEPDASSRSGAGLTVVTFSPDQVTLEVAGVMLRFECIRADDHIWASSPLGSVRLTLLDRLPAPQRAVESGSLIAPMPGNVTRVAAAPGEPVAAGQVVLVIEAMKMEHTITAPAAGVLTELRVGPGDQVNGGDVLAIVAVQESQTATGASRPEAE